MKPFSWTPAELLPDRLRWMGTQTSMVISDIRVLHNAEIERSVLLLTLVARAVLVVLAPLLGTWTHADTPLTATGPLADAVWLLAAAVSLATLVKGPLIVDEAMTDSAEAQRFRHRLLRVEVPIALAVLLLQPAWTVVVFVTGWTNWWQRQTEGLEFDWLKLAVFIGAVVGLQAAGLALQGVAVGPAIAEVVVALLAIAVTGGSYGAMLPLTIATAITVVVGDGTRSIKVAHATRRELLACSLQLSQTAAEIDAAAPEMPLARHAAALARKGAEDLERDSERYGQQGARTKRVLGDLCAQALTQSRLDPEDSSAYRDARQAAKAIGEPEPPYAMPPILGPLTLARLASRRHANVLRRFLVVALNEASVHGTGGVLVVARRRDERLLVAVGNLPRRIAADGASEGGVQLRLLASNLPRGRLTEPAGLRDGAEIGSPLPGPWWVVEAECDIAVLKNPLE